MLHHQRIYEALEQKKTEFQNYEHHQQTDIFMLTSIVERLSKLPFEQVCEQLSCEESPGAIPSKEFIKYPSLVVPFQKQFVTHQDAREWAASILQHHPVLAVDGSQLLPSKELSVPVAVVQAGWYLNYHHPNGLFEKNVQTEIIGPEELFASGSEDKIFHEQMISLRRYEMEIQVLLDFFHNETILASNSPLALFDGSLLVSFAEILMELYRARYLNASTSLLTRSEEKHFSLLGYIDTSVARDLIRMIQFLFPDIAQKEGMRDTSLASSLLSSWGDRSIAWQLARPGILQQYNHAGQGIGFVYLRTKTHRPPVRIEFPMWLYHQGLLDHALDLLRAEIIVGNGYPYALETADQIAWFSPRDRMQFTKLLNSFLSQNQLSVQMSAKQMSKFRRR